MHCSAPVVVVDRAVAAIIVVIGMQQFWINLLKFVENYWCDKNGLRLEDRVVLLDSYVFDISSACHCCSIEAKSRFQMLQ